MDYSKLNQKTDIPNISGNWNKILYADLDWIEEMPARSANKAIITDDIVFKTGKAWVPLYATAKTTMKEDTGSELPDNDAVTSSFKMKAPMDIYRREFINTHGKKKCILLVQKCGQPYPELMGDKCSYVVMSWVRTEGVNPGDENLIEFTFTREGAYVDAEYRGTVEGNNTFTADDATPSVADGSTFFTSSDNTGPLSITDLDDAVVGKTYTIMGADGDETTTIANAGNFTLTADWTGAVGGYIHLYCRGAGDFVELSRG